MSIYLGNGQGGFSPPVTYDAGPDPTGLTVADVNRDGKLDLLVGNAYGDVLVLLGNGDGTFRPYRKADQAVALAVADLTGDGKPDFIYANQGLDRVGRRSTAASQSQAVLGDRSTGLLAPGAVKLADLNGDGIPDLIVANSGSNNVLVYPGLGDGQFGPAVNGGHGFFAGTNPTGITVADLNGDGQPDLVVANTGSNDVSVLLGQGSGLELDADPRAADQDRRRAGGHGRGRHPGRRQARPGRGQPAGQQRPGLPRRRRRVLQRPDPDDLRRRPGAQRAVPGQLQRLGPGIATLNAGLERRISLIGPAGGDPDDPHRRLAAASGFAGDFTGNGFTDLVVGNNGDGRSALLMGGPGGLSLCQTISSAEAPSPTALSFGGVSDGVLSFYVGTAGREAATSLAFNLERRPGLGGRRDLGGRHPHGGVVGRRCCRRRRAVRCSRCPSS